MNGVHSQRQQQQQPEPSQFQGSFNCYETFPATSPPEQQQQLASQNQAHFFQPNPSAGFLAQPAAQAPQPPGQDDLTGYMAVGDPQPVSQSQAGQSIAQPGGYYYFQPPIAPVPNQSSFGFQGPLRPLPATMSGIQPSIIPDQSMQAQLIQPIAMHGAMVSGVNNQQKRKEIYRYTAPHELYSCSWSTRPEPQFKFRIAVGSFIEEYNNKISIVQLREDQGDFVHIESFDHPYPSTKISWIPDPKGSHPDLLATTGDYLRLWRINPHGGANMETLLNNNRTSDYCAPLTSSDWNETDVSLIGTSSIDTTCTIWQIETGQAVANTARAIEGTIKTQLIAHDKEVYDIAFSKLGSGKDIFASVGADGSVRMFDLRHMEYSTILFEEPNRRPLLRLAWNKKDHNYLATFAKGSSEVYILDIRVPSVPIATLKNHQASISGVVWAPHSPNHICTAGDDSQALIWALHAMPRAVEDPILAYAAGGEINHVDWSTTFTDWISICYGNSLELLRV